MPRRWLICTTTLLLTLIRCASHVPVAPGELGLQFTGMWQGAPVMNVGYQKRSYPFLVRLTGYVPPEAEHLVIRNQGRDMAQWSIQWLDIMQTSPQRKYSTVWPMTVEDYYAVQDRASQGAFVPGSPISSGVDLLLQAEVHSQNERILAAKTLFVHVECDACGV